MNQANIMMSEQDKKNLNCRVVLMDNGEYRLKANSERFGGVMHINVETVRLRSVCINGKYIDVSGLSDAFGSSYANVLSEVQQICNMRFFDEAQSINLKELLDQLVSLQNSCADKELFDFLVWDSMSGGFYVKTNKYLSVLTVIEVHNFLSRRGYSVQEIREALQYANLQEIYDNIRFISE